MTTIKHPVSYLRRPTDHLHTPTLPSPRHSSSITGGQEGRWVDWAFLMYHFLDFAKAFVDLALRPFDLRRFTLKKGFWKLYGTLMVDKHLLKAFLGP